MIEKVESKKYRGNIIKLTTAAEAI